ncbi:MAG: hypothetical protein ACLPY1_25410 [Terracidiphilus sp.]
MHQARHALFLAVLLAVGLGMARTASAQVVYSGDEGGYSLRVGATASGYQVQYGQEKLGGIGGVVDLDTRRRIGIEAEGHWLKFNSPDQTQVRTWMGGARYHFSKGKFQIYGKGLIGIGQFTFPYNYAHGNYLVIAPGAGVDYRWKRRISFRLVDFEYQVWPQFTYGSMGSPGVNVGVQYHIF